MIVRPEDKGVLRVFDPLPYPRFDVSDCILNLTVFLENGAIRRTENGLRLPTSNAREMHHLKKNIDIFTHLKPSKKEDFIMDVVVTVNGHLNDDESISYLKSIHGLKENKTRFTVHQRPNVGWQWGSLWDVWQRWKEANCDFWVSKECDWHFQIPNWFDVLHDKLYSVHNSCFVSGHERKFKFDPYEYEGPLSKETWRDKLNSPIKNATWDDVKHVQPSYYFMHKSFLQHMDHVFGCFTYALDKTYELDAIVYGEIGFSQKAKALGYNWVEFDDLTYNEDY